MHGSLPISNWIVHLIIFVQKHFVITFLTYTCSVYLIWTLHRVSFCWFHEIKIASWVFRRTEIVFPWFNVHHTASLWLLLSLVASEPMLYVPLVNLLERLCWRMLYWTLTLAKCWLRLFLRVNQLMWIRWRITFWTFSDFLPSYHVTLQYTSLIQEYLPVVSSFVHAFIECLPRWKLILIIAS